MKIWLDDIRSPPSEDWVHVPSVNVAINLISFIPELGEEFEEISLDHDLGDWAHDGGDAILLVDWMAEHEIWPTKGLTIHSGNPVGRDNMLRTIDRYSPYPLKGYGTSRGF